MEIFQTRDKGISVLKSLKKDIMRGSLKKQREKSCIGWWMADILNKSGISIKDKVEDKETWRSLVKNIF